VNCRRSQELMSDFVEGTLGPPLDRELRAHLATCLECRELIEALREVMESLRSFSAPEPSERLTERILERTRPVLEAARAAVEEDPFSGPTLWRTASGWLAAAAVLASVLLWHPPELVEGWSRRVSQSAHQAYSFGIRSYHRGERWVDELNVLRMTVEVAFENRLDRINERLRDLEQARRKTSGEGNDDSSRSGLVPESEVASSEATTTRSSL
jgi:Putative zinc-finger